MIPSLLILATLVSSGYAVFLVTMFTGTTNVQESISIDHATQTVDNIFPTQEATFTFKVFNTAPVAQIVQLDVSLSAPAGVCLKQPNGLTVNGVSPMPITLCGSVSAQFGMTGHPITGPTEADVSITVHAASDAAPGSVTLTVNVSRV